MEKIMNSIKAPFKKGLITGSLDILFRVISLAIWLVTVKLLLRFMWEAIFLETVSSQKVWWLTYSMMMFIMVTVLAYTAVWDRE